MPRNRRSAKAAGSRFESLIASGLAELLDDDRIERRAKSGAKDRGDITGIKVHGQRLVIEAKDCARIDLPGWIREAHAEAANDDALLGVVTFKRRGKGDAASQYVVMELRDLVALITGQPQEGRYD